MNYFVTWIQQLFFFFSQGLQEAPHIQDTIIIKAEVIRAEQDMAHHPNRSHPDITSEEVYCLFPTHRLIEHRTDVISLFS